MTNPDNAASDTFADKVSQALKNATLTEDGKLSLPKDLSEDVKFAANAEKRRRDTQGHLTKLAQERASLLAEKEELLKQLKQNTKPILSSEQLAELEDLKVSDPDKWRTTLNSMEDKAKSELASSVHERLGEVAAKTAAQSELENRKLILEEFQSENPEFVINDDVISNDIPPRISRKLEKGDITFREFLEQCQNYLAKGKVLSDGQKVLNQPNLSKVGGDHEPSDDAKKSSQVLSYNDSRY